MKASSLFCTDVVLNKANALRKKGVIEQMEFTINIQNDSIDQKTLASLKMHWTFLINNNTQNLDFSSNC